MCGRRGLRSLSKRPGGVKEVLGVSISDIESACMYGKQSTSLSSRAVWVTIFDNVNNICCSMQ